MLFDRLIDVDRIKEWNIEAGYRDENGQLLYQALRYQTENGKAFRQRKPDGNDGWDWKVADVRRVLYRLPELIAADPTQMIFVAQETDSGGKLLNMVPQFAGSVDLIVQCYTVLLRGPAFELMN